MPDSALQTIVVAHDLSQVAGRALSYAGEIAAAARSELVVVHVYDSTAHEWMARSGSIARVSLPDERYLEFLDYELARELHVRLGANNRALHYVVHGTVSAGLLNSVRELGADLLVMGRTGRGSVECSLLGSTSLDVARQSPVPVLFVQ